MEDVTRVRRVSDSISNCRAYTNSTPAACLHTFELRDIYLAPRQPLFRKVRPRRLLVCTHMRKVTPVTYDCETARTADESDLNEVMNLSTFIDEGRQTFRPHTLLREGVMRVNSGASQLWDAIAVQLWVQQDFLDPNLNVAFVSEKNAS